MRFLTFRCFVLAAAILLPGLASAQIGTSLSCSAGISASVLLRAESVSDQIADIVVSCTGGSVFEYTYGQPLPTAAFTVTLATNVTSRLLNTNVTPSVSEALLLIDEPGGASTAPQTVCSSASAGAGSGGCPQYPIASGLGAVMSSSPGSVTNPANVYQGLWNPSAPNQITFPAVPILAPVYNGVTRVYRITNIRADIAALVVAGFTGSQALSASVSISGSNLIYLGAAPQTAGIIQTSQSVTTRNLANTGGQAAPSYAPCLLAGSMIPVGLLQFSENFAAAYKTRVVQTSATNGGQEPSLTQNSPGTLYNSESGFTVQTPNGVAGLADYGTRLKATFHGIPSGTRMFVSVNNVTNSSVTAPSNSAQAALVTGQTSPDASVQIPNGAAAYPAVSASTVVAGIPAAEILPDNTGAATAVWESITNNPGGLDQYEFVVYVLFTNSAAGATVTVNQSYAPTPPAGSSTSALNAWSTASATLTLPRFLDTSTAQNMYLTTQAGACSQPILSITKTHAGGFAYGATGQPYTIVVSNSVNSLSATSGTVQVTDAMPGGLSATSISGIGWSCNLSNLTCTRGDALSPGASYQPITIMVNVASNAASPETNIVTVSGGGSASASASDVTYIGSGPPAVSVFFPSSGSVGLSPNLTLSWGASAGATSYQLYLGTSPSPPAYATTGATAYAVSLSTDTTYYWSVAAVNSAGSTASAIQTFTTLTNGSLFVPVTPCRVIDTRNPNGTFGGPYVGGGGTRTVPIPTSACGIPTTATAYSLNVTVAPHGSLNYLTVWPAGQSQPFVSTLNSPNGAVVANAAIVPAGSAANGYGVNVFASNDTDVILDINGYFAPSTSAGALSFYQVSPCRVVDTRSSNSQFGPYLAGGSIRSIVIPSGPCGVPNTAQAYSLNVTVAPHGPLQYLTVWPEGLAQPYVSTLNSNSGNVVANAAIVPAGGPFAGPGGIDVFTTNDTDLVIDVTGYFAAPGAPGALAFYSLTPCRLSDTRNGSGAIPGGSSELFTVQGNCGVTSTALAYALNVTAVPNGSLNYLTIWPQGLTQPYVSTLNSPTGTVVANAAIIGSGANGAIYVYVSDASNVVLDINGYFGQ